MYHGVLSHETIEILKAAKEARHLTYQEIADYMDLAKAQSVANYFNGECIPSAVNWFDLCEILHVDPVKTIKGEW